MLRLTWWVSVGVAALACGGESITHQGHDSGAHDHGAAPASGGSQQTPVAGAGGSSGAPGTTAGRAGRPGDFDPPAAPVGGAGGEGNEEGTGARDAGVPTDAGVTTDAGIPKDAGQPSDGGTLKDAGEADALPPVNECTVSSSPAILELADWDEPMPKRTQQEAFDTATEYIVGSWRGLVTTPWIPDYEVSLWFDASGHWGGSCAVESEMCCVAFYYGTDLDCDLKRYSIDDATLSGKATGTIDIPFWYGETGCGLPSWQGELSSVALDADLDRLRFDFSRSDGYGPVHFELERTDD